MNMQIAVDELIATLNLDDEDLVIDEKFKDALKNLLADLFFLQDDPDDLTSQEMLYYIQLELSWILSQIPSLATIDELPRLCVIAAQIAAMRGNIYYRRAYNYTDYLEIYSRYFGDYSNWNYSALVILTMLENSMLILQGAIAYGYELDLDLPKEVIYEYNPLGENAIELASRLHNSKAMKNLLLSCEIHDLVANKMMLMIESSGLIESGHLKYLDDDKSEFKASLTRLIKQFIFDGVINVCHKSIDNLDHIKPRDSGMMINLTCDRLFSAELEDGLEIFATILQELKTESSRMQFFNSERSVTPEVLCALSFHIASVLGKHGPDCLLTLETHVNFLKYIFPTEVFTVAKLIHWKMEILALLKIIPKKVEYDFLKGQKFFLPNSLSAINALFISALLEDHHRLMCLLMMEVDPNCAEFLTKKTALHIAAESASLACVKLLLDHEGTNIHAKDIDNKTAYDLAILSKNPLWKNQEGLLSRLKGKSIVHSSSSTAVLSTPLRDLINHSTQAVYSNFPDVGKSSEQEYRLVKGP